MNDSSRSFVPMEWLFIGLGVLGIAPAWLWGYFLRG